MTTPRTVLYCIDCEYDLAGLDSAGNCPECGCTIERSMRGPLLRHEDPAWLKHLTLGFAMLWWGVRAVGWSLICLLAAVIAMLSIGLVLGGGGLQKFAGGALMISMLSLGLGSCVLLVWGAWQATRVKRSGTSPLGSARAPLRWLSWSPVAVLVLIPFASGVAKNTINPMGVRTTLIVVVAFAFGAYRWALITSMRALISRTSVFTPTHRLMLRKLQRGTVFITGILLLPIASIAVPGSIPPDVSDGLASLAGIYGVLSLHGSLKQTLEALRTEQTGVRSEVAPPAFPTSTVQPPDLSDVNTGAS